MNNDFWQRVLREGPDMSKRWELGPRNSILRSVQSPKGFYPSSYILWVSLKESEVLSACLIRYVDGASGCVTEKILMKFPLRPKEQESANPSECVQMPGPGGISQTQAILPGWDTFSPWNFWWGEVEEPTENHGAPCKVRDFGQCSVSAQEGSLRLNPWVFYSKLTLSRG